MPMADLADCPKGRAPSMWSATAFRGPKANLEMDFSNPLPKCLALGFAVCSIHPAFCAEPDYATLTRDLYSAFDRADTVAVDRVLCRKFISISPRGLLSDRDHFLRGVATPSGRNAGVYRKWGAVETHALGSGQLVTGDLSLHAKATAAGVDSMVSAHWSTQGHRPCVSVLQRMAAGDAAEAAFWNETFVLGEGFNLAPNN